MILTKPDILILSIFAVAFIWFIWTHLCADLPDDVFSRLKRKGTFRQRVRQRADEYRRFRDSRK